MSKAPAHKPAPAEPAAAHKTLHKRLSELCVDEIISYPEAKKLSLDEQKVSALYMPCGKCSKGKTSKYPSLSYIRVADAVYSIADGKAERLYCMCIEQMRRNAAANKINNPIYSLINNPIKNPINNPIYNPIKNARVACGGSPKRKDSCGKGAWNPRPGRGAHGGGAERHCIRHQPGLSAQQPRAPCHAPHLYDGDTIP
jgi:hypothetical protein